MTTHYLDRMFAPRAIAVFGASERPDSVGAQVYANLLAGGYQGATYAVNPGRKEVQGDPCYPSIAAVIAVAGQPVDLAVIATPAATVPEILHQCGERGVRAAIVLSAGFGEIQARAHGLEAALLQEARRYRLRILGPNCLGFMNPHLGINATFSKSQAHPGTLALVSQSGALCTAILDWADVHDVGFSMLVSLGQAADVGLGEVLDYLALDPGTESILLYVEGVRHARSFMSGLRAAARLKPVVVVKAGRHAEGSRAAASHTGALVGADDAFDAALRRAGAVRAMTVEQLFAAAQLLATHRTVAGDRLAIITNAGGPGVMATDRAVDLGVEIPALSADTMACLTESLPANWSHGNPVDILGDAPPERYQAALTACLRDPVVDGALVMLTPQAMTRPLEAARTVVASAAGCGKPVLACWMGERLVEEARSYFSQHRIPHFPSPETSVEAFSYLARYRRNQEFLMQVPGPRAHRARPDSEGARLIVEAVLAEGRDTLTLTESKAVLNAFRVPVIPSVEADSANHALIAAASVGLPVAMKIHSPDITHKSDVGGVRLDIRSARDVRSAFSEIVARARKARPDAVISGVTVEPMVRRPNGRELHVGVLRDPIFGPVISFGAGGRAVEIVHDRAVALPPLNAFIAREMIAETRVAAMLASFRNMPAASIDAIVDVLLRLSSLVCELPHVRELDINPLVADETGAVALDCRIVVERPAASLYPYAHMAIHPYPSHLDSTWQLAEGTMITIRPIRPEDAQIEQTFVRELSPQSRRFRFMYTLKELSQEMLVRFTQIDYDREMAFIAVTEGEGEGKELELGVARYATMPDGKACEFALVVADEWQGKGIGTRLMTCLMQVARDRGLDVMEGEVLTDNISMLRLVGELGFVIRPDDDDPGIQVVTKELQD
jgi:acetyltransferase